jgi:hypothetical protein
MTHERLSRQSIFGLGAIILSMAGLSLWILQTAGPAHASLERQRKSEIAAENRSFCEKWALPAGTSQHVACVADLTTIRARHEKRILSYSDLL